MKRALALLLTVSAAAMGAPNITQILGQPTDRSVTLGVRADANLEVYVEYGLSPANYSSQTKAVSLTADPFAARFYITQVAIAPLQPDRRYFYRLLTRDAGSGGAFSAGSEYSFYTQRPQGSTFTFCVQGDSHPEREKTMFSPALYTQTLMAVAREQPDFYVTSGDDFSVDTLQPPYTSTSVTGRYTLQLPYLDLLARLSPLFLVTGNHEQTSLANLNLPPDSNNSNQVPVWAQNAHNLYYPSPAPDDPVTGNFYTGNTTRIPGIGLLRDYYSWEWGDALFVVIDPYWSSPVQVDAWLGGQNSTSGRASDRWAVTHGDAQYQWFKRTLEQSKAKWKFVFAHHVMGSGRGGIEVADLYEWGGNNNNGTPGFAANRRDWPLPIHQLMAANHVTIFFQAHDHLFARQQLDGVIYQSLPNPADNTYTAFNADAYTSGDVFPNSGYTKVTVAPAEVKVEYVRQWLPQDEKPPAQLSGMVQFAYTVRVAPEITSVTTAAGESPTIAPNTWIAIKGSNLSASAPRSWQASDFQDDRLPPQLDGASVSINGRPAYVSYISPTQINVLTSPDQIAGSAAVQVSADGRVIAAFTAKADSAAPGFFSVAEGTVAAVHSDGSLISPAAPARPGETVTVYGAGFGAVSAPITPGSLLQSGVLEPPPVVRIGNSTAEVRFAGLISPGLYQFNVVIPPETPDGNQPVTATHKGFTTPAGVRLAIRR